MDIKEQKMDNSDLLLECCYLPENNFSLLLGADHDHKDYLHVRRTMEFHEIILVKRGVLYIGEDGIRYPLREGQLLFLEAGKEHGGFKSADVFFFCIHFFAGELVPRKAEHLRLIARMQPESVAQQAFCVPKYAQLNNPDPVYSAFSDCLIQSKRKNLYSDMRIFWRFLNLTSLILDDVIYQTDFDNEVGSSLGKVQKMIDFINDNITTQPTITDISRKVRLNPDYANRLFKKVHGCSIQEYLIRAVCEQIGRASCRERV